jgi:hypothetical protein
VTNGFPHILLYIRAFPHILDNLSSYDFAPDPFRIFFYVRKILPKLFNSDTEATVVRIATLRAFEIAN